MVRNFAIWGCYHILRKGIRKRCLPDIFVAVVDLVAFSFQYLQDDNDYTYPLEAYLDHDNDRMVVLEGYTCVPLVAVPNEMLRD